MICPNCGSSSNNKKFCGDCGSPLPWRCTCGNENPTSKSLCSDCGAVAPDRCLAAQFRNVVAGTTQPERRQLTIMFADLVGSTALGARLDPEDMRDVIATYYDCVAGLVVRFGGFVASYYGDGVLAYFGYPQGHEDDSERAIRAGLAIAEAVGRLATIAGPAGTLSARVGIATGVTIVGDLVSTGVSLEFTVVGESPPTLPRGSRPSPSRVWSWWRTRPAVLPAVSSSTVIWARRRSRD